jgi:hypothetical protein
MVLIPGSRLGSHEITARLGEGGMGEVYRAMDTRLRRSVAIKVLPAALTADADRLLRFERLPPDGCGGACGDGDTGVTAFSPIDGIGEHEIRR